MSQIFLISDTHFSHSNICNFLRDDGSPLRPWSNCEEMDEALIENWNRVVKPKDKIYHLGDVAIPRKGLKKLEQLNGDKVLIAGNHDVMYIKELSKYFRAIRPYWVMQNLLMSHVPIHPNSIRNFRCNIHGHLHYREVMLEDNSIDPRYLSVCVELTDYSPILLDQVIATIESRS